MKNFLNWRTALAAAAVGLGLAAPAQAQQQLTLKGVPVPPQLLPLDGRGYLSLYRSEAGEDGHDIYAVRVLGNDLAVKHQYQLPVPVGAAPLAVLPGRASAGLAFYNQGAGQLALYSFDPQTGAQLGRELVAPPLSGRAPTGQPLVARTPTDGFCVVQSYRRDTAGYAISVLSPDMKTEWSHMYFPKDLRQHEPLRVAASKDVITLLLSDTHVVNPNTPKQRYVNEFLVLGIDRASGRVLYRTPTQRDGLTLLPTQLLPLSDGRVATAGVYFNSRQTRLDSAQGVFLTTYRPDGSAAAPVLTPWSELGRTLGDADLGTKIQTRKAYLPLHELVTTTGTDARLIGEYDAPLPGPFVVLSYDATGKLAAAYPVARTQRTGSTSNEQLYGRYAGIIGKQGEPFLLYTGVEGNQPYTYATVLANVPTRTATRAPAALPKPVEPAAPVAATPLDPLTQRLEAFRSKLNTAAATVDKFMYGSTPPPTVYFEPDPLSGFVAGTPGQVLLYRYDPARKQLLLQTVAMQ